MNLKLILRTYAAYRQMSPDDIALLETLRGMTDDELAYFAQRLQPQKPVGEAGEQQPTPAKPRKGKCTDCAYFKVDPIHHDSAVEGYHVYQPAERKSARAASLESAIKTHSGARCVAELASTGKPCGMARPHVIHSDHNQDVDAHDFLSAEQLGSRRRGQRQLALCAYVSEDGDDPTQCGEAESSGIHDPAMGYRNYHPFQPAAQDVEPASTPASSETQPVDAGGVHHAASSGD